MSIRSIALSALVAAACSSELAERPPARDPRSISSDEAPLPHVPTYETDPLLASTDEPRSPKPTVYTCPMHPEIEHAEPGSCPKCGMTLVGKSHDR